MLSLSGCRTVVEREIVFSDIRETPPELMGKLRIAQNEVSVVVAGTDKVIDVKEAGNYYLVNDGVYAELLRVYELYASKKLIEASEK